MAGAFRGTAQLDTVAVIGAGLIGAGWAATYLAAGLRVRVCDPAADAAEKTRAHVAAAWPHLVALGLAPGASQSSLSFHADVEDAANGADLVQESAPEREALKSELYQRLDAVAPSDVIIASSTSSFPITQLQAACRHPARCVLGHPFNPVHLIPLVEVGGGSATDPAAVATAMAIYRHLGKHPIRIDREIFGHVANRLASAMFREAVHLVDSGVISVEGIDDALRYGPALKWAIQGQFMTYHTSGGEGGMAKFLATFGPGIEKRWEQLGAPRLTPELCAIIVEQTDREVAGRGNAEIAAEQDDKLLRLRRLFENGGQ